MKQQTIVNHFYNSINHLYLDRLSNAVTEFEIARALVNFAKLYNDCIDYDGCINEAIKEYNETTLDEELEREEDDADYESTFKPITFSQFLDDITKAMNEVDKLDYFI